MEDHIARTRETYDKVASPFLRNTRDRSVIREWLDRFAGLLPAHARVLDVGSGPGFDSSEMRTRGLRPISVDLSLGMLRAGLREFPGPRVQADVRSLPFPSASMAGVWANACLLHLSQPETSSALEEIGRVLRPAGLLHVSVKLGSGAEWESDRYGQPRWFQYWSASELDAALASAGFRVQSSWVNETNRATWLIRFASLERRA